MIPDYTVKEVEKPFADESDSEDETSIDISDIPLIYILLIQQRNFFMKLLLVYAQDLKNC